ncbi:hypothetical protein THOB06_230086 [Vibrio rotiferianus]|nr:hypothetical protein THOG10_230086 [Vibrio rotiferianus]CAH1577562.1 hypothetical protein THOB06_230086 [Vibrio rotiferianus]
MVPQNETDLGLSFQAYMQKFLEEEHKKTKGIYYCGIFLNKICQLSVVQ